MIKQAVIGYLIQWSSHSWYDILFLCNYAAPTAPHVFIASSTHVKLKSSLCTWYLIIACCTTMHNGKMSKPAIYSTSSDNRYAAITEHSRTYTDTQIGIWILNMNGNIFQLVYPQSAFYTSLCHHKGNLAYEGIAFQERELKANVCSQYEKNNNAHRVNTFLLNSCYIVDKV